jgi:hypothetical protein
MSIADGTLGLGISVDFINKGLTSEHGFHQIKVLILPLVILDLLI